jgi:hypothetical protein
MTTIYLTHLHASQFGLAISTSHNSPNAGENACYKSVWDVLVLSMMTSNNAIMDRIPQFDIEDKEKHGYDIE